MLDADYIARELYNAYCAAAGGVAYNGDTLPDWETFKNDPTKKLQYEGWIAVAVRADERLPF